MEFQHAGLEVLPDEARRAAWEAELAGGAGVQARFRFRVAQARHAADLLEERGEAGEGAIG